MRFSWNFARSLNLFEMIFNNLRIRFFLPDKPCTGDAVERRTDIMAHPGTGKLFSREFALSASIAQQLFIFQLSFKLPGVPPPLNNPVARIENMTVGPGPPAG